MTAIPPSVQTVLELFATELAGVRFGDLDAQALAKAAADVASAEAVFLEARGKLEERQEALLQQAQRALAYARVYAEADDALRARLESISLPRAPRRARADGTAATPGVVDASASSERRPRGRPRKLAVGDSVSVEG